ncbi:MAG: PP2C family serine/threonine-protein phosphatase [Candidatus Babeliales bacterium]|nr:PP2C family serine/threonine-protein phosphatase [Candidatus Babeliales bacterium]
MNKFKILIIALCLISNINALDYGFNSSTPEKNVDEVLCSGELYKGNNCEMQYFGIFASKGDSKIATILKKQLHKKVLSLLVSDVQDSFKDKIKKGFEQVNNKLQDNKFPDINQSASRALAIIKISQNLYIANVGNSRAVMSVNGSPEVLTKYNSHLFGKKVENPAAMDADQSIIEDIKTVEIKRSSEFIVLASKEIWDVFTDQQVVDFVREQYKKTTDCSLIAERLVNAVIETGNNSNMAVMIIGLNDLSVAPTSSSSSAASGSSASLSLSEASASSAAPQIPISDQIASRMEVMRQNCKRQIRSFLFRNYNNKYLWGMLSTIVAMYIYRNKIEHYYNIMRKVVKSSSTIQRGYLTFIGGTAAIVFVGRQKLLRNNSQDDSQDNLQDGRAASSSALTRSSRKPKNNIESNVGFTVQEGDDIRNVMQDLGLNSGYHAIKNGCYVWQELSADVATEGARKKLLSDTKKKLLEKDDADLDTVINSIGNRCDDVEDAKNKDELIENMNLELMKQVMREWKKVNDANYTIMPNIEEDGYSLMPNAETDEEKDTKYAEDIRMLDLFDSFKKDIKKTHLFILGTQRENAKFWFSVVVNKQKQAGTENLEYHVMNSHSVYKLDTVVDELKKLVEGKGLGVIKARLKLENIKIEELISEIVKSTTSYMFSQHRRWNDNICMGAIEAISRLTEKIDLIIMENDLPLRKLFKDLYYEAICSSPNGIISKFRPLFSLGGKLAGNRHLGELQDKVKQVFDGLD